MNLQCRSRSLQTALRAILVGIPLSAGVWAADQSKKADSSVATVQGIPFSPVIHGMESGIVRTNGVDARTDEIPIARDLVSFAANNCPSFRANAQALFDHKPVLESQFYLSLAACAEKWRGRKWP